MEVNLDRHEEKRQKQPAVHDTPSPLEQALAAREKFLNNYPHLRSYQAEIEQILDKSGNCQGRMAVLGTLMQAKLLEMQKALCEAALILGDTVKA